KKPAQTVERRLPRRARTRNASPSVVQSGVVAWDQATWLLTRMCVEQPAMNRAATTPPTRPASTRPSHHATPTVSTPVMNTSRRGSHGLRPNVQKPSASTQFQNDPMYGSTLVRGAASPCTMLYEIPTSFVSSVKVGISQRFG